MSHQITIGGVTTAVIAYQDVRICTTQQLAEFYGCSEKQLSDNFGNNRDRFKEGRHFVRLEGDAFRSFKTGLPDEIGEPLKFAPKAILWTEKGAARHAKMLTTEKAWEVFEQLEDAYFRVKEVRQPQSDPMAVLSDPAAMRGLLLTYTEKVIELQHTVQEQAPKAAFHDQVVQSERNHELGEAAKLIGTGRTRLARWMREHRWINRRGEPYQDKIEAGLLDLKYSKKWTHPEKGEMRSITTMVTGKGLVKLQRLFPAQKPDLFAGPVLT